MSWSPAMRENRRQRGGQADMFDSAALAWKLVCDGRPPLTNEFVVARKVHACCLCMGPVKIGERVRRETRRSEDGKTIEVRHVCPACCDQIGAQIREHWAQLKAISADPAPTVSRPAGRLGIPW